MKKTLLTWLMVLGVVGAIVSAYALSHHYGYSEGGICNINDTFSCDVVNKSVYSEIVGVPVALVGIVGYLLIATAAFIKRREKKVDVMLTKFLVVASFGALCFSLYLTAVEIFILKAYCPTCLVSQATILAIFILTLLVHKQEKNPTPSKQEEPKPTSV